MKTLIIGYGNELRSDDGVGPAIVAELHRWDLSDVELISVLQLTPELADPLAQCTVALFIDAFVISSSAQSLQIKPLTAASTFGSLSSPEELLGLSQILYGRTPVAGWILVPGENFSLGETLSPVAVAGMGAALRWLRVFLFSESDPAQLICAEMEARRQHA